MRSLLLTGLLAVSLLGSAAEPAAQGATAACQQSAPAPVYFTGSQVDVLSFLPPPPPVASPEQEADLKAVLAAQRAARANGTMARAIADSEQTCARFKDVMGPELKSPAAARPLRFLSDAAQSVAIVTSPLKRYWKRPRPFVVSRDVERLADVAVGGSAPHEEDPQSHCGAPAPMTAEDATRRSARDVRENFLRDHTSYPSGHSAYGMACALLLAAVVPEKRAEILARGRLYGDSRVIVGAHYPTDVAAGQQMAFVAMTLLLQNASFERQFVRAQAELRQALGLPIVLPDLEPNKDLFSEVR